MYTKDTEKRYAPLVMVSTGAGKRTLAVQTVYKNGSIDTSFDPPLFSLDSIPLNVLPQITVSTYIYIEYSLHCRHGNNSSKYIQSFLHFGISFGLPAFLFLYMYGYQYKVTFIST
jgi:hypothetical protein